MISLNEKITLKQGMFERPHKEVVGFGYYLINLVIHTHTHTLIYIPEVNAYIDTFIHTYHNRKSNILGNEQCGRTMVTILHGMAIEKYGTPAGKYFTKLLQIVKYSSRPIRDRSSK